MEKVTYFVSYPTESFSTELVDEAKHAFDEGAQVVEVRELFWIVGRSRIEIVVTTQWQRLTLAGSSSRSSASPAGGRARRAVFPGFVVKKGSGMSIQELKEKYGVRGSVGAVNAAIRAEIPGGANVLDALTALRPALLRSSGRTRRDLETTFERLQSARSAMVDDVARRYELKSRRSQTEGGRDENFAERGV